jgi:hypothetical protein
VNEHRWRAFIEELFVATLAFAAGIILATALCGR